MAMEEKLERNIDIYVERKKGTTYRVLQEKHNLSQARVQDIVAKMEKKLSNMPQLAALLKERYGSNKFLKDK